MIEARNARIRRTTLGTESHGILTAMIDLDYGGVGQGFGGYGFDRPIKHDGVFSHREGVAWGMEFINRLLKTVGVTQWEDLPGTPVRVKASHSKVHAIGHFIEDKWFEPEVDLAHLLREAP